MLRISRDVGEGVSVLHPTIRSYEVHLMNLWRNYVTQIVKHIQFIDYAVNFVDYVHVPSNSRASVAVLMHPGEKMRKWRVNPDSRHTRGYDRLRSRITVQRRRHSMLRISQRSHNTSQDTHDHPRRPFRAVTTAKATGQFPAREMSRNCKRENHDYAV